jgi:hypothetical protein
LRGTKKGQNVLRRKVNKTTDERKIVNERGSLRKQEEEARIDSPVSE